MRILTDSHLGRRAVAHTQNLSSKLLDAAILKNTLTAATNEYGQLVVHVGDLFDKSHNPEHVLLDGLKVAQKCDVILAGNHDLANREGTKTSIEVVGEVHDNLCRAEVSEVKFEDYEDDSDGTLFTIIPHHSSQDLFDKAVDLVSSGPAMGGTEGKKDIVFLHCNFNNPFAQNDASLNLSTEQAERLLTHFKYIVMGHEHNHRWEMDNRLLILGNTHPTNFGDIADKYFWDYNKDNGFTKTLCWSKDEHFIKVKVGDLLSSGLVLKNSPNFIEIVGEKIDPALAPELAAAMQDIWETCDDNLFMVRNNVQFKTIESTTIDTEVQLEDVTKAITEDLAETDLLPLWQKHLGAANA